MQKIISTVYTNNLRFYGFLVIKVNIDYGKSVNAPIDALEGAISIVEDASVMGGDKKPVLGAPLKINDLVEITDDFKVRKLNNGVCIGRVEVVGTWKDGIDPTHDYTENEALAEGKLRVMNIETFFKKIYDYTADGEIAIGAYIVPTKTGFKASENPTGFIALSKNNNNSVIVGVR